MAILKPRSVSQKDAEIGLRIRAKRLQADMSQEKLGTELGVSFQQVQKYEKGTNRVSSARLHEIADALGCNVVELMTGGFTPQVAESSPITEFLATGDGLRMVRAMMAIEDVKVRRSLISLAETLGPGA